MLLASLVTECQLRILLLVSSSSTKNQTSLQSFSAMIVLIMEREFQKAEE